MLAVCLSYVVTFDKKLRLRYPQNIQPQSEGWKEYCYQLLDLLLHANRWGLEKLDS